MNRTAIPLFVLRGGNKISSSPLLVDANGDGWPEVFVGGPVLRGMSWDGRPLPGWPKRGGRPFASSPSFGDVSGERRGSVVIGCDDGRVYAFHLDGARQRGWPVATGSDVFSTPALADIDKDGAAETIVGSDDGGIYRIRGDGTVSSAVNVPNRPFVSASPTVVDLDSDGALEVVIGAWDATLYLIRDNGSSQPIPLATADHIIWSSATAFETQGLGACFAFCADRVHLVTPKGTPLPGWPRRTGSWMVSSPTIAELVPGAGARVIAAGDRLYVWDLLGRLQPGWPQDCGEFVWASPLAFDVDGDGIREVVVASWDGRVYAFRPDGRPVEGFSLWTGGAAFATPGVAPIPSGGGVLVTASWDGSIRGWGLPQARFSPGDWLQFRGGATRTGNAEGVYRVPQGEPAMPDPSPAPARVEHARVSRWAMGRGLQRFEVEGSNLGAAGRLMVEYSISRGRGKGLAPVVQANHRSVAILQALRRPHIISYHVSYRDETGSTVKWPEKRDASFVSTPIWVRRRPRENAPERKSKAQGVRSTSAEPDGYPTR